ncbi:hypothetical protein [Flectobacillus rivi]|uniref:Uncharacterized protein n=1 Tax=Flectobacillus rivi TaxID=2984209 RepID=A0ABT6Z1I0_9BACT|nr:hypothetical protein [Flectobacillus rivi]MDI9875000.1 hypothetical protein [Flectobacillus rivi]
MSNKYIFSISYQNSKILADSYLYGHNLSIVRIEDDDMPPECYFTSPHLSRLEDPNEVWSRALSLITMYNGVCNLDFRSNNENSQISKLGLVRLFEWDSFEDITPNNSLDIAPSNPFDEQLTLNNTYVTKSHRLAFLTELAKNNDDIYHILTQLGNGLNWRNLYAIYDTIVTVSNRLENSSFPTVLSNTSFSNTDVNAFKATVNNFGLLGVEARHGELGFNTPKKTLNLPDSQNLILELCNSFIRLKYE